MRPLRYSINVTLDGCCDHRVMIADEELHRHAVENLEQADALLFGRVTYEMMEAAWRRPARAGAMPDWMEPFGRTIDAAKKYVVSSTLDRVDWNVELVRAARTIRVPRKRGEWPNLAILMSLPVHQLNASTIARTMPASVCHQSASSPGRPSLR
jgi:hypothetical protein